MKLINLGFGFFYLAFAIILTAYPGGILSAGESLIIANLWFVAGQLEDSNEAL